ncbi:unnamed protein product, partial [Adineta steineri]
MFSRNRLAARTNVQKKPQLTTSGRTEAVASFVQQRIWLHEQFYFHSSDLPVYNILAPLIIKQVEYVHGMATNYMKYSYFPLQHILAQHSDCAKPTFLDISFDFVTIEKKIMIGNSELCSIPLSITINEDEDASKFDFILTIQYDLNINQFP